MANLSTYLEEALLDHVLRNTSFTSPTTVYAGLVSDAASDADMEAGTLTNEITDYTGDRKAVTFDAPTQSGGASITANSAAVEFEDMPAATVRYLILCDAATAGNVLWWGQLTADKTTSDGDTLRFPAGDIDISLD